MSIHSFTSSSNCNKRECDDDGDISSSSSGSSIDHNGHATPSRQKATGIHGTANSGQQLWTVVGCCLLLGALVVVASHVKGALETEQARARALLVKKDLCSVRCTSCNFSSYGLQMKPFELPAALLCKQHEGGGMEASAEHPLGRHRLARGIRIGGSRLLTDKAPEEPAQFAIFKVARSGSTWFHSVLMQALASRELKVLVGAPSLRVCACVYDGGGGGGGWQHSLRIANTHNAALVCPPSSPHPHASRCAQRYTVVDLGTFLQIRVSQHSHNRQLS